MKDHDNFSLPPIDVAYLREHSGLPGPRGNLELMYRFSRDASPSEIAACMAYSRDDLSNSPEEFVLVCGIVATFVSRRESLYSVISDMRHYASHSSWRVREAVAMGIQEIADGRVGEIIDSLSSWLTGNEYERRAFVAALCEPRLLKDDVNTERVLAALEVLTRDFSAQVAKTARISDAQKTLRKTLGYGWSVALAYLSPQKRTEGERLFERCFVPPADSHALWIARENLKKSRLEKMDGLWVSRVRDALSGGRSFG